MNEDRAWDRITDAIETKFGIDRHGKLERKLPEAMHLTEQVAFVEFTRAGDEYRLERVTGPAIIDRRSIGARRAGSETRFETIYDPEETAHKTLVYKQVAGEWESVSVEELGLA